MHRILLREVVIDAPSTTFSAARDFWTAALAATAHVVPDHTEFTSLEDAAALLHVGMQDIGSDVARYHLDIESDDVEAEVTRLVGLGATEVNRHRSWVVLRDPAGLLLCVVPPESSDFETRSHAVE
jgi:hypothetical protein